MKAEQFTATARPLDFSYPANIAITALSAAAGMSGFLAGVIRGSGVLPAVLNGVVTGVSVFLSWALARELDPDHELSAFPGAAAVFPAALFLSAADFAALFLVLLLLRIINRITGLPAKPADPILVLILTFYLLIRGSWFYCVPAAVGLFADALLPPRRPGRLYFLLPLMPLFLFPLFSGENGSGQAHLSRGLLIATAVTAICFSVFTLRNRALTSTADMNGQALNPRRFTAARILTLFILFGQLFLSGRSGFLDLLPLWAATAGICTYRIIRIPALVFLRK